MNKYNPEEVYQEFWKSIICDKDGNVDVEQVKKELCDYYYMLQEVPSVYSEVTGGMLSKPLYDAKYVLDFFYEKYADKTAYVDCLVDDWDFVTEECTTNEDYKKAIFAYLEVEEE